MTGTITLMEAVVGLEQPERDRIEKLYARLGIKLNGAMSIYFYPTPLLEALVERLEALEARDDFGDSNRL